MKYKVTLNGKTYEVEVDKGEAILVDEYAAYAPAVPTPAAPAPVQAAAAPVAPAAPAAPAASAPAGTAVQGSGEVIAAPMPGTILNIKVSVGSAVKKGQVLLILEAMKMENEIVAPHDGTIGAIPVNQGATVETGTPLVIMGDPGSVAAPAPAAPAAPAPAPAPAPAVQAPAAAPSSIAGGEVIAAPMPGTILGIKVSQGSAVKKGQVLLILEAMKMENEIVAPRDGVVAQIVTSQGASVETGAALVVLG